MKSLSTLLFLTFCILIFQSCTVEKRLHNRGFHVEWRKRFSHKEIQKTNSSENELQVNHAFVAKSESQELLNEIIIDELIPSRAGEEKKVSSVPVQVVHNNSPPDTLSEKVADEDSRMAKARKHQLKSLGVFGTITAGWALFFAFILNPAAAIAFGIMALVFWICFFRVRSGKIPPKNPSKKKEYVTPENPEIATSKKYTRERKTNSVFVLGVLTLVSAIISGSLILEASVASTTATVAFFGALFGLFFGLVACGLLLAFIAYMVKPIVAEGESEPETVEEPEIKEEKPPLSPEEKKKKNLMVGILFGLIFVIFGAMMLH